MSLGLSDLEKRKLKSKPKTEKKAVPKISESPEKNQPVEASPENAPQRPWHAPSSSSAVMKRYKKKELRDITLEEARELTKVSYEDNLTLNLNDPGFILRQVVTSGHDLIHSVSPKLGRKFKKLLHQFNFDI